MSHHRGLEHTGPTSFSGRSFNCGQKSLENILRKTLAVISATSALLFGGAGVAHATASDAPAPSSTTTTLADDTQMQDHDSDKTGLWGLTGLLGLIGLAGLKRRKDADYPANRTAGAVTNPRA